MKAQFIQSAERLEQVPHWGRPEVVIVGRSNAGKSSFVNALTGRSLARVSRQPGHTRVMNFFDIDAKWILVDLPGYGYAARSHQERTSWGEAIKEYLDQREALRGLLLIMDSRRDWSEDEEWVRDYSTSQGLGFLVLANKSDKLNQKEHHQRNKYLSEALEQTPYYFVSATKKHGVARVLSYIEEHWVR